MSWKTPRLEGDYLHDHEGKQIVALNSKDWFAWADDEENRAFHYVDPTGGFCARKERKQRGQWYWVAYRQIHNHLHKAYLGKTETLTKARLGAASELLAKHAVEEV